MALTWLFIVDPLDHLKEYKDSTVAMMREAARRGHIVHAGTPAELSFDSHDGAGAHAVASASDHSAAPTPGTSTRGCAITR